MFREIRIIIDFVRMAAYSLMKMWYSSYRLWLFLVGQGHCPCFGFPVPGPRPSLSTPAQSKSRNRLLYSSFKLLSSVAPEANCHLHPTPKKPLFLLCSSFSTPFSRSKFREYSFLFTKCSLHFLPPCLWLWFQRHFLLEVPRAFFI